MNGSNGFNPLQIQDPNAQSGNPLLGGTPSPGQALATTGSALTDWLAQQRAKSVAMGYLDPNTGLPTSAGIINAAQQYGNALVLGTSAPEGAGITAYHGSPYSFERFDPSKIGTGEGAQAYGHGLYFAESEPVAQGYRDRLTGKASPTPGASDYVPGFAVNGVYPPTGMSGHAAMDTAIDMHGLFSYMDMYANKPSMSVFWKPGDPITPDFDARPSYVGSINYLKGQIEQRIQNFRDRLGDNEPNGIAERDMAAQADYYDTHVKDATPYDITRRPPGSMYQVNLQADPEHFLDWDKPLSEQSPHVQDALKEWNRYQTGGNKLPQEVLPGMQPTGAHVYGHISNVFGGSNIGEPGPRIAAEELRDNGIPGIRYLDQGSRAAGQGTSNYVVFNPDIISIIRKYGIAGLIGSGTAAATATGDQGQQPQQ